MNLKEIFTYENLLDAHKKARRGKLSKEEVASFDADCAYEVFKLYEELNNGRYRLSPYKTFYIYEPKKRRVDATCYRDRVMQSCLASNYLAPLLERHLIYDNAACRESKGTDFARKRLRGFLASSFKEHGRDFYVLSFDIHHYFESIDHSILKDKLRKIVKEDDVLSFLFMIIDSYESSPGKGLPLGNQSSQWFALLYLDRMDRIVKERFRLRCYSRYMDDGVAFSQDKALLKRVLEEIRVEAVSLKLSFNPNKTGVHHIKQGVSYLGFSYHLSSTGRILSFMVGKKRKRLMNHLKGKKIPSMTLLSYRKYLERRSSHHRLVLFFKKERGRALEEEASRMGES